MAIMSACLVEQRGSIPLRGAKKMLTTNTIEYIIVVMNDAVVEQLAAREPHKLETRFESCDRNQYRRVTWL